MTQKQTFAAVFGIVVVVILLYFGYVNEMREFEEHQKEFRSLAYIDELISHQDSITVFKSIDTSEAFQWAMDNHNGSDGVIYSENGWIYVNLTITNKRGFYRGNFTDECFFGITAYDSIFTNCTIDNSVLYHCELIDSNVTRTFVYASLFDYLYGLRYIDCSGERASYNITTWWGNP